MVVHRHERLIRDGRGEGRVVTDPRRRQQVGLDGPTDELVAQEDAVGVLEGEPVGERLVEAGCEIRVEHAIAVTWRARGARRTARRPDLEGFGDGGHGLA